MKLTRPQPLALLAAVAVAALAVTACDSDSNDADTADRDPIVADGFAVVDEDPIDYEACARISEDVQSLLDSTMSCERDSTCDMIPASDMLEDACLPSISCYLAVADPVELQPIREELRELDDEYREACGLCPVANCVDEDRVYSQCEDGSCDVETRAQTPGTISMAMN